VQECELIRKEIDVRENLDASLNLTKTYPQIQKENHMRKSALLFIAALGLSSIVLLGCSSGPSKDDLNQLATMRSEISSLSQRSAALMQEKAALQKAISEKQQSLKTCQDDKQNVQSEMKFGN
jgi:outer membrane murein-binding lipoprotein Lpp